jgi:hypothetical protein
MGLGITEAVDLSGRLVELVKAGATIELREKIMELREAVLNTKEEVLALRAENAELKRAATEKNLMKFEQGLYWLGEGSTREGPFCPKCRDDEQKNARLQAAGSNSGWRWRCLICKNLYGSQSGDPYQGFRR